MMTLDKIKNYNDLIIELEARLSKEPSNRGILIREIFVLWYVLLEGIKCENFNEGMLGKLLKEKFDMFQKAFNEDLDFIFIVGWMLSIAPWYFDSDLTEDDGYKFLYKAYKANSRNSLYKWAFRGQLNLTDKEMQNLNTDLKKNLDIYFNYGAAVKDYFLSLLK
ncbi:MAG: hypothetical protein KF763_19890 [Cyclobacteriaceae bacterium]|nr:hypothetical protein [Cyclobacteriaceae bacterium]